jgi:hypothetical protein
MSKKAADHHRRAVEHASEKLLGMAPKSVGRMQMQTNGKAGATVGHAQNTVLQAKDAVRKAAERVAE